MSKTTILGLVNKSVPMKRIKLNMPDGSFNGSNVFLLKDAKGNPITLKYTELLETIYIIFEKFNPNIKATLSFYNLALEPLVVLANDIDVSDLSISKKPFIAHRGEFNGSLSDVNIGLTFNIPVTNLDARISAIGSVQKVKFMC